MTGSYPTCPIKKRNRRTKTQLNEILLACQDVINEEGAVTLRHLFYRIVSLGLLKKTEEEYDKLSGYTMKWRRDGSIAWSSFVDSTRWYHGAQLFDNLGAALENSKACYRRNLWQSQNIYVEIWMEKDAVAAIAQQAAQPFGVPVFPMKGFASGSALFTLAQTIRYHQAHGKVVHIYYLGDHDPSGRCMDGTIVRSLRYDHGVEFNFTRIAVTQDQIKQYNLPTRPTKESDSRAKNFKGESVEVDALPPHIIRQLVERSISQHIDPAAWQREIEIEEMERGTFDLMADAFERGDFGVEA